ncbi:Glutamine--tRNA ligase [compost metagenome]
MCTAFVEPSLAKAEPGVGIQFERHGYFVADTKTDLRGKRVFNRAAGMRDSWGK